MENSKKTQALWTKVYFFIFILIISSSFVLAYTPLEINPENNCNENLNLCLASNQKLGNTNEELLLKINSLEKERDLWKELYLSTNLTDFSVERLDSFEEKITNIYNYYNLTYQEIINLNNQLIFIKKFQIVISIVFILSLGLIGFSLFKIKNNFMTSILSIKQSLKQTLNIKNEKHTEIHKHSKDPSSERH